MKEKVKRILILINQWKLILIILLVGFGLFYWYQIRPSQTYSDCYEQAIEAAIKKCTFCGEGKFRIDDYEGYYKMCLSKYGINK